MKLRIINSNEDQQNEHCQTAHFTSSDISEREIKTHCVDAERVLHRDRVVDCDTKRTMTNNVSHVVCTGDVYNCRNRRV